MRNLQKKKLEQAKELLHNSNIDMWVMLLRETVMQRDPAMPLICDIYFSGLAAIIVEKTGKVVAITSYLEHNSALQTGLFDEALSYKTSFEEAFAEYFKGRENSTIALDYSTMDPSADGLTYGVFLRFQKLLTECGYTGEIVSGEQLIGDLRAIKTDEEVDCLRRAAALTLRIFEEAKDFIKIGVTERQIFDFFHERSEHYGTIPSWEYNQCPGVSVYPDTPSGHCGPTDIAVKKGSLIGIDFGVVIDGYCSDMQRVYYVCKDGETDAPKSIREAFYAVRDTIEEARKNLKTGVTGNQMDTMAREYLSSRGGTDWPHSLGHQVGLAVHDGGAMLSRRKKDNARLIDCPLKAGYVFAIEPATYIDEGCICIEEMALVTDQGGVFLSDPQQELYVLKG